MKDISFDTMTGAEATARIGSQMNDSAMLFFPEYADMIITATDESQKVVGIIHLKIDNENKHAHILHVEN